MLDTITAIYENGMFRPLEAVKLKEHQRIKIRIEPDTKWRQELRKLLKEVYRSRAKYPAQETERDITRASQEVKRNRRANRSLT